MDIYEFMVKIKENKLSVIYTYDNRIGASIKGAIHAYGSRDRVEPLLPRFDSLNSNVTKVHISHDVSKIEVFNMINLPGYIGKWHNRLMDKLESIDAELLEVK